MFEALGFTLTQLELWLLALVRIFALLSVLPFFSYETLDVRLRAILAVVLATMMVNVVTFPAENFPVDFLTLMFYAAREVLVGLCIGLFASFFVEIMKFAGHLASHMMGLSLASMIDPTTSEETEAMSELFNIVAILLILTINGHHFFLRAMFDTLYVIPISAVNFTDALVPQMISLASQIITVSIRLSAPIVIIVFLVRIIVGIMNRLVQDADVFSVIMIVNILIGLYILIYYWMYFAQMANLTYNMTQTQVMRVIRLLSPT